MIENQTARRPSKIFAPFTPNAMIDIDIEIEGR